MCIRDSGSGADIVEVRDSTVTQYATNEWIADLQKYIDGLDEKDTLTESADEVIHYPVSYTHRPWQPRLQPQSHRCEAAVRMQEHEGLQGLSLIHI